MKKQLTYVTPQTLVQSLTNDFGPKISEEAYSMFVAECTLNDINIHNIIDFEYCKNKEVYENWSSTLCNIFITICFMSEDVGYHMTIKMDR